MDQYYTDDSNDRPYNLNTGKGQRYKESEGQKVDLKTEYDYWTEKSNL